MNNAWYHALIMVKQVQGILSGVVFMALLAVPVIGFSHATIPHAHTHASDNALHTAIEHGLDSSLSRKDIVLPVFLFLLLVAIGSRDLLSHTRAVSHHEAPLLQALRRGVLSHRRFR